MAQAQVPVTFGQPFKAGDWPAAQGLIAKDSSGNTIPLQVDEISTHRDGSNRFAVLSAQVPNVAANTPKLINIYLGAKSSATQTLPASPDWNLEIEAKVYNGSTLVSTMTARPQEQLKTQIAQGTGRRLNGSVATEFTVVAPFKDNATNAEHAHLNARLHTRLYEGGARIRTDMVLENNWTFKPNPGNITYELTVRRNGQVIYTQPRFTHNHHARWHKVLWTGSEPQYRLRHHMPYFLASRSTWNYDLSMRISETTLAQEARDLAAADTKPMGRAFLTAYFPTTGGRPEIGPIPRWTALYLITQDDRARASMLANADAAAGVPVHYRDEKTNQPLDVINVNPNVTVLFGNSSPALPAVSGTTIYEPDTPHQGSFAYIPYLITGDSFYLDEVMFWAAWNIANVNPIYRESKGLIVENQIRGQAWAMRSLMEAAFAVPDSHPQKSYFRAALQNNIDWYRTNGTNNSKVSPLGAIEDRYAAGRAVPWNNDFMGIVFSLLAENAEPRAKEVLDWFSIFNVGRYMNEAAGFCTVKAPGYYWYISDTSGKFITTWRELFARNYPEAVNTPCSSLTINTEAYPDSAEGYAANSRAALAAAANASVSNASAAYTRWKGFTPKLEAAFLTDPTWAIVPR